MRPFNRPIRQADTNEHHPVGHGGNAVAPAEHQPAMYRNGKNELPKLSKRRGAPVGNARGGPVPGAGPRVAAMAIPPTIYDTSPGATRGSYQPTRAGQTQRVTKRKPKGAWANGWGWQNRQYV